MSRRLELQIDCGNAAFFDQQGNHHDDERRRECAAILKEAARRLESGQEGFDLRDTNGGKVGSLVFIKTRRRKEKK